MYIYKSYRMDQLTNQYPMEKKKMNNYLFIFYLLTPSDLLLVFVQLSVHTRLLSKRSIYDF
jgi:hypothetical protein